MQVIYLCKEEQVCLRLNENLMQTITIELTGNASLKALKDLEHKNLIRILKEPDINSYSLPGKPISKEDFKSWIEYAESTPTVSLTEVKLRWAEQKKKLRKLIR
jgi:hypothetical protein